VLEDAQVPRAIDRRGPERKALEVTVSRTSNMEIERGYIAQRGQEEWNQRAKAFLEKRHPNFTQRP